MPPAVERRTRLRLAENAHDAQAPKRSSELGAWARRRHTFLREMDVTVSPGTGSNPTGTGCAVGPARMGLNNGKPLRSAE